MAVIGEQRSERDTLSRSSMKNAIRIYIYISYYIDTEKYCESVTVY